MNFVGMVTEPETEGSIWEGSWASEVSAMEVRKCFEEFEEQSQQLVQVGSETFPSSCMVIDIISRVYRRLSSGQFTNYTPFRRTRMIMSLYLGTLCDGSIFIIVR